MLKESIYFFFTVFLFYSYDWFQTDSLITIVIYTKQKVGVFYKRENYKIQFDPACIPGELY